MTAGPIASYRRYWLPEVVALSASALAAAILFQVTDLDIESARVFYHPDLADPWPVADHPLWSLFYRSAPWVTASLAVAGTAALVAGEVREEWTRFRRYGLFVLLCVIVGPGLIVNGILKDHWGRPRPRQVVEFGGRYAYAPPLLPSGAHGKSFPCGHCSVGYLYAVGWWIGRRRRPGWAAGSLAAGTILGTLLGIGRMAAGGHFLSDVVWSALISFGVAHVLYYYVIGIPAREDVDAAPVPRPRRSTRRNAGAIAASILLCAGIIGGGILASPQHKDLTARIRLADFPAEPKVVEILVDTLDVELLLVTPPPADLECAGFVHGFGLPTNEIREAWEFEQAPVPILRYRVSMTGWFTDIDGVATIRLPCRNLTRVIVRVGRGDIRVVDETGGGSARGCSPALDLHTGDGRVRKP